jgi:hypothetical protein
LQNQGLAVGAAWSCAVSVTGAGRRINMRGAPGVAHPRCSPAQIGPRLRRRLAPNCGGVSRHVDDAGWLEPRNVPLHSKEQKRGWQLDIRTILPSYLSIALCLKIILTYDGNLIRKYDAMVRRTCSGHWPGLSWHDSAAALAHRQRQEGPSQRADSARTAG